MSYYQLWQIEFYGGALEETNPQEDENGFIDRELSEVKADNNAELNLIELQY